MNGLNKTLALFYCFCLLVGASMQVVGSATESTSSAQAAGSRIQLNLTKAIELAVQNNLRGRIAREDVQIAMALQGQALSSWWPQVTASVVGTQLDHDPNFIFPATQFVLPPSAIPIPSTTIPIPANAFGPGFPPVDIPLTTQPSQIDLPAQVFPIPKQDIKLMDSTTFVGSLDLMFPIYTGGLRPSKIKQAGFGVEAARQEERRTDLEVIYDVKRVYNGVVLAGRLLQISQDTLARMEATLQLTEELYKTGSGTVKKTDYLRNKSVVETIRSVVTELESNEKTSRAALLTVIGLDWNTEIEIADKEIPFNAGEYDPKVLIERAYSSSPEMARVEAGLKAAEAGIRAAKSGYLPKIGLFGSVKAIGNEFDEGIVTPENKITWAFGFGLDIPVFEGFRVQHEVGEARAKLRKLTHQMSLLGDAIALKVKRTCFQLAKTRDQQRSTFDAYQSAVENRELNTRAYQDELVETKDVIQSQLMEALLSGQYQKVLYEHVEGQAKLDFIVGSPTS